MSFVILKILEIIICNDFFHALASIKVGSVNIKWILTKVIFFYIILSKLYNFQITCNKRSTLYFLFYKITKMKEIKDRRPDKIYN